MRERTEFSAKIKAEAALRAKGKCEGCGARLFVGNIFYDHRIPDAMGGAADLVNYDVLCRACHDTKTRKHDVPDIAKAKRRFRNANGIRKPSRFLCSRSSRFKQKIGGRVVLR